MPLLVCSTNQGSSQPATMKTRPAITRAVKPPDDSSRAASDAGGGGSSGGVRSSSPGGSAVAGPAVSVTASSSPVGSGTVGHPHAEQADRPHDKDDDQHREDNRGVPARADELTTEP